MGVSFYKGCVCRGVHVGVFFYSLFSGNLHATFRSSSPFFLLLRSRVPLPLKAENEKMGPKMQKKKVFCGKLWKEKILYFTFPQNIFTKNSFYKSVKIQYKISYPIFFGRAFCILPFFYSILLFYSVCMREKETFCRSFRPSLAYRPK